MATQPLIGITTATTTFEGLERSFANTGYVESVRIAGGIPLLLPQQGGDELIAALVSRLDGVVFTGGQDIEPARYGEARERVMQTSDAQRDAFELALYHAAREHSIPVLAICRGCQLVNVAHGGSLIQDIATHVPDALPHAQPKLSPRDARVHDVTLEPGSAILSACGVRTLCTNSFHHQAIKQLGDDLRIIARAPDGIIEAVEQTRGAWLLGVQWHPEAFWREADCADQRIFSAFIVAAQQSRTER